MATIVNTPSQVPQSSNNGMWNFLGLLLVVVTIFIFIFYGIPFIRNSIGNIGTPQINVPEKIDINVKQTK